MDNMKSMNEELKKEHLRGLHKEHEVDYVDSCILCEAFLSSKKNGTLNGEDLDLFVSDELPLTDIFGK